MEHVFNMGVGMTAVVASADAEDAIGLLAERGVPAWPLGKIVSGTGRARLTGRHR
jgi:phosphoribosylformylglycinamidine cyclo-ligase